MSRLKHIWIILLALVVSLVSFGNSASAAVPEDGTYTINYTVIQGDNDSVSMANDYWEKPAKLTVKDGQMQIQMTVNHSSWVTEFKVPTGGGFADTTVVSEDTSSDTRVTEFSVADISSPLESKIHVTVPDIDYDHDYTIRFRFDEASLTSAGGAENSSSTEEAASSGNSSSTEEAASSENSSSTDGTPASGNSDDGDADVSDAAAQNQESNPKEVKAENPQTGENNSILTWGIVALAALGLFIGFKYVTSKTRGREN
ncbi:heme uptake protein IsdC [Terribacillus saccharophilus]|uniref:heme uptake protein IsdC n=1 Tax=Terribacillus saccharophilus TaxID=361277 RepID=UPI002DC4719A|nr:heme uptake protein IsdC [Terribacillus saccharophilus]MEC0291755.1 heme uptake protein IsdC [Terribacillus saccharophilus]